jgi:predicted nucleotidyltransferase
MVNTNKPKLTLLQQEILRLLFKRSGDSLNQRQIANALNVTPPAVLKSLPFLEKMDYITIKKDKETKRLSIELNKRNHKVMQLKRVDNLKQIYESGLSDYLEKEFAGATIILFGSYSRGDDLINSDIDIAIIGRKEKKINLEDYEKRLERKINVNYYDSFEKIHTNLKENLANGIVLSGGFQL